MRECWCDFDFLPPDQLTRRDLSSAECCDLTRREVESKALEGMNVRALHLFHITDWYSRPILSSSPASSLLPTLCYLLWLQSWTQSSKDQKIIRKENCSWHYFWKAGYCNESRAGIHCVWGRDWKPLVFLGGLPRRSPGGVSRALLSPLMHVGTEPWEDKAEVSSTMAGAKGTAE